MLDGIFGTVAAQLALGAGGPSRRARRDPVTMSYRCAGDSASVRVVAPDR